MILPTNHDNELASLPRLAPLTVWGVFALRTNETALLLSNEAIGDGGIGDAQGIAAAMALGATRHRLPALSGGHQAAREIRTTVCGHCWRSANLGVARPQ